MSSPNDSSKTTPSAMEDVGLHPSLMVRLLDNDGASTRTIYT